MTLTPFFGSPGRMLATAGTLVSLSSAWFTSQTDRSRLESLYADLGLQPMATSQHAEIADPEKFRWPRFINVLHRLHCHAGKYAALDICQQHLLLRGGVDQPMLCRVTLVDADMSIPPFLLRRSISAEPSVARIGFGIKLRFPEDSVFDGHYCLSSTEGLSTRALFNEQIRTYLNTRELLAVESNGNQLVLISAVPSAPQTSVESQEIQQSLDESVNLHTLIRDSAVRCFGESLAA